MSINYPTTLDNFTNPTPADNLNTPAVLHSTQHSNLNDAVEALQAKVGVDNSADINSLDYKVANDLVPYTGATANVDLGNNSLTSASTSSSLEVIAGENLAAGDLINIYNNAGTSTARKADNLLNYKAHGFVLASVTAAAMATVYLSGVISGLTALTPGTQMFLGVTGLATATAPSAPAVISQQIGVCTSSTTIAFNPQMTIGLAAGSNILMETSGSVLLEDGSYILLE